MNKFCLILIFCLSLFATNSYAQQADNLGLSVYPQIFELEMFQGQKFQEKITIGNLSDVSLPVLVKITDFTATDVSGEMEFDESLQDPIIASKKWFEIENPNFILEPEERRIINFEISVPKNAEPGGHYSVILFEPQLPSFYFKPGQPKTIPVVGVLFLISVKSLSLDPTDIEKPIEVTGFKIPEKEKSKNLERILASIVNIIPTVSAANINILDENPSSFILQIKNNDIFHHKVSGKILIYNSFGKMVGKTEVKKTTVLPGKIREFSINASQEVPGFLNWLPASISGFLVKNTSLGKYLVVLEAGEELNQIEISDSINFWIFPWKMMLILFILMVGTLIIRKRIFAAVKILFRHN
ncbi:hypothetical protein ACFLYY_00705 [Patescibacteria group bacterium]